MLVHALLDFNHQPAHHEQSLTHTTDSTESEKLKFGGSLTDKQETTPLRNDETANDKKLGELLSSALSLAVDKHCNEGIKPSMSQSATGASGKYTSFLH